MIIENQLGWKSSTIRELSCSSSAFRVFFMFSSYCLLRISRIRLINRLYYSLALTNYAVYCVFLAYFLPTTLEPLTITVEVLLLRNLLWERERVVIWELDMVLFRYVWEPAIEEPEGLQFYNWRTTCSKNYICLNWNSRLRAIDYKVGRD